MPFKRLADMSGSSLKKFSLCRRFAKEISTNYDPESCLQIMRAVCEKRNKALQGPEKALAKYQMGNTYYERDVRYDISQFMRFINRQVGKKLSSDYAAYLLYCQQQKKYFSSLRPVKKRRRCEESMYPGKTAFNEAGIYNGLP